MDALQREKLRDLVIRELTRIGGYPKGSDMKIICPFHDDHTPSLGVSIDPEKPGIFKCFSCPDGRGHWNKLAWKLGLEPFDFGGDGKFTDGDDPFAILANSLKREAVVEQPHYLLGVEPLPPKFKWRGLDASFYKQFGAGFYWDKNKDIEWLYFPLTMNGVYKGYTVCKLNREPDDKLKYMTFADTSSTLFLYDTLPQGVPIVINEGHFDSLRLRACGIWSTAVFGVENWSPIKKSYLMGKMPSKVMIVYDGDEVGHKAAQSLFLDLRDAFDVDIYYLPITPDKLDPGNMPDPYVEDLRRRLYA